MKLFAKLTKINYNKYLKILALSLPWLILLTPEVRLFRPYFRLEDLALLAMVLMYGIKLVYVDKFRIKLNIFDYIFALLLASSLLSMVYGYLSPTVHFVVADLFEPLKIVRYYLFFRIISGIKWTVSDYRKVIMGFVVPSALVVAFAFLQYLNFMDINLITLYYSIPYHVDRVARLGRVVGTFRNANYLGIFLVIPVTLSFVGIFRGFYQKNIRKIFPWFLLLFGSLTIFSMTLSRTSLVAVLCAIFLIASVTFVALSRQDKSNRLALSLFSVFVFFSIAGIGSYALVETLPHRPSRINFMQRMDAGIREITGEEQEAGIVAASWKGRQERWSYAISKISEAPFLGRGPAKSLRGTEGLLHVDNEYLFYTMQYGLVGLFLFIALYGLMLFESLKIFFSDQDISMYMELRLLSISIVFSFVLYNILAGTFYNFQLFTLLIYIFALNYAYRGKVGTGISI